MLSLTIFLPLIAAGVILLIKSPDPEKVRAAAAAHDTKAALRLYRPHALVALVFVAASFVLSVVVFAGMTDDDVPNLEQQLARGDYGTPEAGTFRFGYNEVELAEIQSALANPATSATELVALNARRAAILADDQRIYRAMLGQGTRITPNHARDFKYVEQVDWIRSFNVDYFVGVDGLSAPLVLLTGLIGLLALFASFTTSAVLAKGFKGYLAMFLLLQTGLMGVFVSLDFFLFYVFWEVVLLPMYFLIGIWGGPRRIYAAIKFFIYTLIGSVLMFLVMLFFYFRMQSDAGSATFNSLVLMNWLPTYLQAFQDVQLWCFWGMFLAFAVKVPLVPFHTWLPDAHVEAPTPISMILAGLLLKMGAYGYFRFSYTFFPDAGATEGVIWAVGTIGVINIVYGALCAMGQTDFKKLVAYSSISHMGYVMLGLAAMTPLAMSGAAMQMFNHGLSSAMMFMVVGVIYERAHHRDINNFGGLGLTMPWYAGLAMVAFFASLALPGLNGFISEAMVFIGSFQYEPIRVLVIVASSGIVLTAAYLLWCWQRVYWGTHKQPEYKAYPDLNRWEWATLAPLALGCVVIGLVPSLVIDVFEPAMRSIAGQVQHLMPGVSALAP